MSSLILLMSTCSSLFLLNRGSRHLSLFISSDFLMNSSCLLHNSASRECIMFLFHFYDTSNMINLSTKVIIIEWYYYYLIPIQREVKLIVFTFSKEKLRRQFFRNQILIILLSFLPQWLKQTWSTIKFTTMTLGKCYIIYFQVKD